MRSHSCTARWWGHRPGGVKSHGDVALRDTVGVVGVGWQLGLVTLEVFSNPDDSAML